MAKPDTWMRCPTDELIAEGWKTPNTYSKCYAHIPSDSGVYLLFIFPHFGIGSRVPESRWRDGRVGYVGKSSNLAQRIVGHPVIRRMSRDFPDCYIQRWFQAHPTNQIDAMEIQMIGRFDPPYNVQHREPWKQIIGGGNYAVV